MQKLIVCAVLIALAGVAQAVVSGHTRCTSAHDGTLVQLEVTECTATPCRIVANRETGLRITFIPGRSSASLHLKLTIVMGIIQVPIVDVQAHGSVSGGVTYALSYGLTATDQLVGQSFTLRGQLYESGTSRDEICTNVPCQLVAA